MTEEPYRWLEAVENRREYVREQLKGGSPAFGAKLPDGILLLSVGSGDSKVFELFDRHALAALGHPADIEKIRQAAIDAAHMEAFTRAVGLDPVLADAHYMLGFSAVRTGELERATAAWDTYLRLSPNGGHRATVTQALNHVRSLSSLIQSVNHK